MIVRLSVPDLMMPLQNKTFKKRIDGDEVNRGVNSVTSLFFIFLCWCIVEASEWVSMIEEIIKLTNILRLFASFRSYRDGNETCKLLVEWMHSNTSSGTMNQTFNNDGSERRIASPAQLATQQQKCYEHSGAEWLRPTIDLTVLPSDVLCGKGKTSYNHGKW